MGEEFNPADFLAKIRRSASIKAGAIMFGEAQLAYYETLKQGGMSEEDAYNMLGHVSESVVRGVFASLAPLAEVVARMAAVAEYLDLRPKTDKEVPKDD